MVASNCFNSFVNAFSDGIFIGELSIGNNAL